MAIGQHFEDHYAYPETTKLEDDDGDGDGDDDDDDDDDDDCTVQVLLKSC